MTLWRVSVEARGDEEAELLGLRLLELAPAGLEEAGAAGRVELACFVDDARLDVVRAALPGARAERVREGWEDAWRRFHRAAIVGGLWLGPPWERPPAGLPTVVIDPGRAFGTGAHPTTRLSIELLARLETRGSLLDVGCGSGVLSLAAARLGFAPVQAVDVDPVAVDVARTNAEANGVHLEVGRLDALVEPLPAADVAVVNVLLEPAERILSRVPAAEVITSGYLAGERPAHPGWAHRERLERDGWAADRFSRGARAHGRR